MTMIHLPKWHAFKGVFSSHGILLEQKRFLFRFMGFVFLFKSKPLGRLTRKCMKSTAIWKMQFSVPVEVCVIRAPCLNSGGFVKWTKHLHNRRAGTAAVERPRATFQAHFFESKVRFDEAIFSNPKFSMYGICTFTRNLWWNVGKYALDGASGNYWRIDKETEVRGRVLSCYLNPWPWSWESLMHFLLSIVHQVSSLVSWYIGERLGAKGSKYRGNWKIKVIYARSTFCSSLLMLAPFSSRSYHWRNF